MPEPFDSWLDWLPGPTLAEGDVLKAAASRLVRTVVKACSIGYHLPRKRYAGSHDKRDRRIIVEWVSHGSKLRVQVAADGGMWWDFYNKPKNASVGGWIRPGAELPVELIESARRLNLE